jgi:heme-degrading monooxygenase HmoA
MIHHIDPEGSTERSGNMSRLALFTCALLANPSDDPKSAEFIENAEPVSTNLNNAEGFISSVDAGEHPPVPLRLRGQANVVQTLTLWRDSPSAKNWVYSHPHLGLIQRRKEWMRPLGAPSHVCWWINDDVTPTWPAAITRYETLLDCGPTYAAFTLTWQFDPAGNALFEHNRLNPDRLRSRISTLAHCP